MSMEAQSYASIVEFRVLGPVEALVDERPIQLGGPKQRHVLALLLAETGRPIEVDRLIDGVWGDQASPGARATLQTYVSNLRSEIGDLIQWEGDTYRLTIDRDSVDAHRFEDQVAAARREVDPSRAAKQLRAALALWRGRPFSDIEDVGELRTYRAQLEEMRVAALEARVETDLACGLHLDLVGELEALAAEHPFRERFRAQHMLALYRSGRQAEALRAFQKTRTLLAEELGIDPSLMLQEVEQRILNHDPTLDLEPQVENRAFLFTDLEDSTMLWELHPDAMSGSLRRHDEILRGAVTNLGGSVFKTTGDGLCAVFADVTSAVAAAEQAQRELAEAEWEEAGPLKVRMAIDMGDVETRGDDFFGPPLNRCSRIIAAGHGGQVLISGDAHRALIDDTSGHWQVKALGEYRFKGLGRPQSVYQQVITGLPSDFPPLRIDRMPALVPGTTFGRVVRGYELREQIGGGDFGLLYRAYQPSVGREVAVKVIRPEYVNQPAFVRRFEAEAQLVAQLEHPYVVSLYDYWRDPDGAYLVMRWMRAGSLRQALNRGPWNIEPAVMLLKQIGSALSYAHRQGVVHRDLKPGNVLLDEEGNGYLSDFGIATRLADSSETRQPLSSSPAYLAPEELEGRPLSSLSDIYSLGLLTFELLTGQGPPLDAPLPAVHEIQPKLSPNVDRVIAKATAEDPAMRFRSVDEYLAALGTALDMDASRVVAEPPSLTPARNPYKGLVAFKETDSADFFGRDQVTRDLIQAVGERRLVGVVGPSGIGKSSVIRAGLIPGLRAGGLVGSREWLITDMFPGSYPYEELEAALLKVAIDHPDGFFEDLARDERGLLRSIKRILPVDTEMVLIIDQFEELFTLTVDEQVRNRFVDALVALLDDARSRVRVVLGLRADFFDRPLRYPRFGELLGEGVFPLAAPSRDEIAEAIVRPAQNLGIQLEEGLLNEIVGDISDQPGALPLLQYALTELFRARASNTLTVHGYRSTGGVIGAIPRKADELLAQLDKADQEVTRQVFLRLVAVHQAGSDTRRRVRESELRSMSIDSTSLERILDDFGKYRLLTFDRDPVTRGATVEVAHEAMLTEWHRLRDWIDERREDLLNHRRLSEAEQEWEQSGRDPSYLLSGNRLGRLETWAEQSDLLLTEGERTYLEAALAHEHERERAASDRLLHESQLRRRTRALLGLVATSLLIVLLAVLAFSQRQTADNLADQLSGISTARQLASDSGGVISDDPDLAILLAIEAIRATETSGEVLPEAVDALHWALQASTFEFPAADAAIPVAVRPSPFGSRGVFALLPAEMVDLGQQSVARGFTVAECDRLFPAGGCPDATAPIRREVEIAGGIDAYMSFVGGDAPLSGTRVVVTGQFNEPEAEAFGRALAALGDDLGIDVVYRSAFIPGGPPAVAVSDDPGDIVLVAQPGLIDEIAGERTIVDVGSYIGEQYLRNSYGDYLTSLVALNGTSYGVFMKVDAKSLIWYNSEVFAGAGYAEPSTWVDLVALSDRMVLDGHTPWCFGVAENGWIATDWFESIVLRLEGPDFYDSWVAHEVPFDHPALIEALEQLGALSHTPGYVSPDPGYIDDRPLSEAVFLVSQEDPQCLMLPLPGWAPAYFTPDVPMVAMPFPSIDPAYVSSMVGGGDIAIALSDRPEVRAVMRGFASPTYGALWAESGNPFIAPHREFDMSVYTDPVGRSIAATVRNAIDTGLYRYDAADLMPEQIGLGQLVTALINYLTDPNASAEEALATVEAAWTEYEANNPAAEAAS